MPAKSKAQQKAAGAALAAKRGDKNKSELKGASKSTEESMSEKELHDMASTQRKGKPEHKSKTGAGRRPPRDQATRFRRSTGRRTSSPGGCAS